MQQEVEVAQAAGLIALGNIASRVLGMVREIVKAHLFGAGGDVSALDAAIAVPNIVYALMVGGMVHAVLVPVLSEYAASRHRAELWRSLSVLLGLIVLAGCVFILAGEFLTPGLIWLSAGGLSPSDQRLAVALLRLMLPGVLFLSVAGILSSALYALRRFTLPAFTAAVFNIAMVVMAVLLGRRWGVHSMAAGLLIGSALQVASQMPGFADAHLHPVLDLQDPVLRRIGHLYPPILVGLAVDKLAELLSYRLASHTGPASISLMRYSATIVQFPLGMVVTAVSVAILPTLSRQASDEEPHSFKSTLAQGLRLVLVLTVPATVGLWVLATPVVKLVFEHGDFTPADTSTTASALRCHLVGLIFAAVDQPLIFAFYARKDTWKPALVGVATVILYVILALTPTLFGSLTLNGLILANSLKWAAHASLMLFLLQKSVGGLSGHGVWGALVRAAGLSVVMGGTVHLIEREASWILPTGPVGEILRVVGAGLAGIAVYGVLATVLRMEELRPLRRALLDWGRRLTG